MRRMILVTVSAVTGGVLLMVFGISLLLQAKAADVRMPAQAIRLPVMVEGTNLKAHALGQYNGPSLEDRDSGMVTESAVLLVENTGGCLATGAVVLYTGGIQMVFEIFDLPPGGKALVLEKDGQRYGAEAVSCCYGWERDIYPENTGYVAVKGTRGNIMKVTNLSRDVVPVTRICYKHRDPNSGIFLGGISYSVEVRDLQPGECREIVAPNYNASCHILYVVTWGEE